ncbi:MAG: hypothetical protein AB1391_01505 [Candidatus Micrarchaeota archaeon]
MAYFLKDCIFAAKYPFSSKAKEIIRDQNIDVHETMAERGFERLSSALKGRIKRRIFFHNEDGINEIMAYASARMILSFMRNRFLTNKYAIAESKKTFSYLNEESDENMLLVAKELGINSFFSEDNEHFVGVADFLCYAPKDVHYKLIVRELSNGAVRITKHERMRLISEAVKKYMEKTPEMQSVPPAIKKISEKLYALLPKIEPKKISFREGENPPCIEAILELINKHENIGHSGRWLLAVYLINRGMDNENMMKIFSSAPDFNEKITQYQIEHARKRAYIMPNCSSVLSYGYCTVNCGIINPLNYKKSQNKAL